MHAVPEQQTVVAIEDDPDIADLLDLYLRNAGFRSLLAPSGERGLELVAQHGAALVIVDVGLPGIDGFEVCRRLRRPGAAQPPVLFLTARDDEIDRVVGFELGADDYVDEAVLAARTGRAGQGDPAPRPRWRGRDGHHHRRGADRSTSPAGRSAAATNRSPWRRGSSSSSPSSPPTPASPCRASNCSTTCGVRTGSATSAPSTCTCGSCARSSATISPSPPFGATATASDDDAGAGSHNAHTSPPE